MGQPPDVGVLPTVNGNRARWYPSDLTDAQWEVLRPEAEVVMAELRNGPGGGVMKHDLRAMLDGIGYLTRYGIEWRALPVDFPPWPAVYAFFDRWSRRGLPQRLVDRLRGRIRVACGRKETPTAASVQDRDGAHPLLAALAAKLRSDECVFARAETALDRGTVLNTPLRCG